MEVGFFILLNVLWTTYILYYKAKYLKGTARSLARVPPRTLLRPWIEGTNPAYYIHIENMYAHLHIITTNYGSLEVFPF